MELPGERDNARNNARCTQARKTTHGVCLPNGMSIGLAVLAELTRVCQTRRQTRRLVLRVAAIGEVECAANLRSADRVQSSVTQGHRMPCAMSSVCSAGSVDAQPGVAACARHCGGRGWAGSRPKVASRARPHSFTTAVRGGRFQSLV